MVKRDQLSLEIWKAPYSLWHQGPKATDVFASISGHLLWEKLVVRWCYWKIILNFSKDMEYPCITPNGAGNESNGWEASHHSTSVPGTTLVAALGPPGGSSLSSGPERVQPCLGQEKWHGQASLVPMVGTPRPESSDHSHYSLEL